MLTHAEPDAPSGAATSGARVAATLAAGASLLHWVTIGTQTHSWSAVAAGSLLAGVALMGLALMLVALPWSAGAIRSISLLGAAGTAIVVVAFLLPALSSATSGHAGDAGHPGHEVADGAIALVDIIRTASEVALIGVLAWLYRTTGRRPHPEGQ